MTVFLPVWNSHCTRVRFTVKVPCSDELAVHSCPLCLQRWVANRVVTRLDGARGNKQVWRPVIEPELIQKQIYCIEASTCEIVRTFRRPPE